MREPKLRRWIDLLTALLRRRFGLTFEELTEEVPGYRNGGARSAVRRMFERDKRELREAGVPIETLEGPAENSQVYRLRAENFYLPYLTLRSEGRGGGPRRVSREGYRALGQIAFDPEGLALIKEAAVRAGQLGDPALAELARSAIRTLAFDLPLDSTEPDPLRLAPSPDRIPEPHFAGLDTALRNRKAVTFDYQSMGDRVPRRRTVHPYGLFFLAHHWYLAAAEPGTGVVKNYRLSRIGGLRVARARPGTPDFAVPRGFDLRSHARSRQAWELGAGDGETALVEFRGESGPALAARRLGMEVKGEPLHRRFIMRRREVLARWLFSFGGEVVPLEPPELVGEYRALVAATLAAAEAIGD